MVKMLDLTLDRTIEYNGSVFRIVEILQSATLLVIKEEDYQNGKFPLQTYLIPGK